MNKLSAIVLLGLLFGYNGLAQEEQLISLEEVLGRVQKANTNIKISGLEAEAAKADYSMSNTVFLPDISVSHTGITTTNPLTAFGARLNQEILTSEDFNPLLLNDPDRIENFATIISIQQPLINMDGIFKRKAARSTFRAKELQFQRTREYINFEAQNAYMQLQLAYKVVEVLEKANGAARANEKLAKDYYHQGLIQKADWLQAQVRTAEVSNQLEQARSNRKNTSDYLAFLMDADQMIQYRPKVELLPDSKVTVGESTGLENRADVQAMQKAVDAFTSHYRAGKMTFLPRLNAFGSYELYDQEFLQTNARGYTIGASLSWDVFKGSQRFAQLKKGKANADKAQLQFEEYLVKSEMELDRTRRMLADAENRLRSSELAVQQSAESLQIRTNRFKEGLEKTSDVLMAEARYAQQELNYYQTVYEYNYAIAYHTFLTIEIR